MAELVNHGMAHRAILERWEDVNVSHTMELMAFLWEMPDVISEGFARLLPVALQITGVAQTLVRALKVTGENLSEV
jgi:hypothetical protein